MKKALLIISLAITALSISSAQPQPHGRVVQKQGQNCGNNGNACDVIFESHPSDKETVWEILQPNVVQAQTPYPMIRFKPGDEIKISAGGCVQSGGMGATWHSYTNPQGGDANTYYSGTIYIPGVIDPDPGDVTGYKRIGAYLYEVRGGDYQSGYKYGPVLHVPAAEPRTGKIAGMKPDDIYLHLGFEDTQGNYGDNGYYAKDPGPNNQCLYQGAAWVEVRITHTDSDTSRKPQLSSHFKPFDVVWDENDLDGNWLPLNPKWTAQLGQPSGATDPDFQQVCGPAFPSGHLGDQKIYSGDINQGVLAAQCTTQAPTLDPRGFSLFDAFGMCAPNPLAGHLNWFNVTYKGTIYWEDASGSWPNDNDIDLRLVPDNDGGLTALNSGSLGLEFDAGETINNYQEAYWQPGTLGEAMNGKPAVVTGEMGIDGVHGGWTEIHPVFALAILTDEKVADDGVDDTWVFFLRNSGDEGGCSQNQHNWLGLSENGTGPAWYFLNIPWREYATDFKIIHSQVYASQAGIKGPTSVKGAGWTYLGFQLPSPDTAAASVDGQLTIHYKLSRDHFDRRPPRPRGKGHREEDASYSDVIARVPDPVTRKKINDFFVANKPVYQRAMPHKFPSEAASDELALRAMTSVKDEDRERLRRDHSKADLERQKAMGDFDKKLKAFWPESLKLAPPAPEALNQRN